MKELVGEKIKKYFIVTCPHCGESYRVDWKSILSEFDGYGVDITCPWCESEGHVSWEEILKAEEFQYIRVD